MKDIPIEIKQGFNYEISRVECIKTECKHNLATYQPHDFLCNLKIICINKNGLCAMFEERKEYHGGVNT